MSNELEQIQKSIARIEGKLDKGLIDIRKIESYLYDDDHTSTPGIVQQVREHNNRIGKLEDEEKVKKRVFAIVGGTAGVIGTAIVEFCRWLYTYNPK